MVSNKQLGALAKKKWGLGRLFRFLNARASTYGETVILARILLSAKAVGVTFPRDTISRVIKTEFEEKIPSEAKNWLRDMGRGK